MTTEERNKLPDSEFGIPSKRMFPLCDREHVMKAIQMFRHCPTEDRKELASNIEKKALQYGIKINPKSMVARYLTKDSKALNESADKTEIWQNNFSADNPNIVNGMMDLYKILDESKIWITSDLHLNSREKIVKCVNKHNETVGKNDCLLFLGDLVSDEFSGFMQDHGYEEIAKLQAKKKIMIKGNNDMMDSLFYQEQCGFDYVMEAFRYNDLVFSHCPLPNKLINSGEINVHGHIHDERLWDLYDPTIHLNIYTGKTLTPLSLTTEVKRFKARNEILNQTKLYSEMTKYSNLYDPMELMETGRLNLKGLFEAINESYQLRFDTIINESDKQSLISEIQNLNEVFGRYHYPSEAKNYILEHVTEIQNKFLSKSDKRIIIPRGNN